MKNILYLIFKVVLPWIAIFFHLYIVYIAFKHGILSGFLTLVLPVLSEIYWVIKLWNIDSGIKTMFFIILIGGFFSSFFNKD